MFCLRSGTDLSINPQTLQVTEFRHELAAAASSTSKDRASDFLHRCRAKSEARAYASYSELVNDPGVDIVYIASPHSHHYQNAMLCLLAGKHVLCEKPVTVNALQAKQLFATAKEKNLLLLDGVWIRYFPLSKHVRDTITSGRLGPVQRVLAEHSLPYAEGFADLGHIMVNPDLARGILLDSGIYSLTWAFQCLYTTQPPAERRRPMVKSLSAQYSATGVDAMTSMLLEFPRKEGTGGHAHAVATTSMGLSIDSVSTEKDMEIATIRIHGPKGEI